MWAILLMVSLGTVAIFGIGYAFTVVLRGQGTPDADETGVATISASPLPCATTMVTPAQGSRGGEASSVLPSGG